MACRLSVPSHYLSHYWIIVNWTLWNKRQSNCIWNLSIFIRTHTHTHTHTHIVRWYLATHLNDVRMFRHWNFSVNIGSNSLPWNFLVSGLHSHITVTSYNERDGVSNHLRLECLPNRLFRRRSNEASKLRVSGLCEGNSPVTKEFPAQRASNAENVSIWWRHHELG